MDDLTCYIAGPVTRGDVPRNIANHQDAARQLREEGWDVYSPIEHPRSEDCHRESENLMRKGHQYQNGKIYRTVLMRDFLQEILNRYQVFLLPGWQDSSAATEAFFAHVIGKPIVLYDRLPDRRRPLPDGYSWKLELQTSLEQRASEIFGMDSLGFLGR